MTKYYTHEEMLDTVVGEKGTASNRKAGIWTRWLNRESPANQRFAGDNFYTKRTAPFVYTGSVSH